LTTPQTWGKSSLQPNAGDGWTEEDERLVMEYVTRKPTIIERVIPAGLLFKLRRKYIQDELNRLAAELDNCTLQKA
jgi:hypothetical protein